MLEKYCASHEIDAVMAENGYNNGCHREAWEIINQKVIDGELTAYGVFLYGQDVASSVTFPCDRVAKSLQIKALHNAIQDTLCEDCDVQYPTRAEVWQEMDELIRIGRFTAIDVYYYGALERAITQSTIPDGDGDC